MSLSQSHRAARDINVAAQDIFVHLDGSNDIDPYLATRQILDALRTLPTISYEDAVREAVGLLEPDGLGANREYERGMYELIARMFGDSFLGSDGDTSSGATTVERDVEAKLR